MSEDSWVFDSLVCFLHGPVWNAALQTFIEEKSLSKYSKMLTAIKIDIKLKLKLGERSKTWYFSVCLNFEVIKLVEFKF